MSAPSTRVGSLIDEKYQVLDVIGQGGMSIVWLARDQRLGKLWAIKEIKPNEEGSQGELYRQALVDEAHLMKRLDHPAIPRVVDIIETGASTYVVMDYVEGRSLAQVLAAQGGPFEQEQVIDWGMQLCDVLEYLHGLSPALVYRDMKPANVMLRDDGTVRLIDFGIAMECEQGRNNDGKLVGTPGYAAPEQVEPMLSDIGQGSLGAHVVLDARADIYALGMTLYTLVTAHRPKRVKAEDGSVHVSFETRPIRDWNARLSEGLEIIILRATDQDPNRRYAAVGEMRYDLEHHLELTQEWQRKQRGKVRKLTRLLVASLACVVIGMACLVGERVVRGTSYEELLHAATLASTNAPGGQPSAAERRVLEALSVEPARPDAYEELLRVYESDYVLSVAEEERLRSAFGGARSLKDSESYAQLCFDVGVCYLCYFGVDQGGGSVGNTAIASAEASAPWFKRAIEACETPSQADTQSLSPQDLRAAKTYLLIAQFYDEVTRAGREGTSGEATYKRLWEELSRTLHTEVEAAPARKSAEGVRARLCQLAAEVLASPTYLGGFARAGVSETQAQGLYDDVRACVEELGPFSMADEYQEVYAPLFAEVGESLGIVQTTIQGVYHNPVSNLGRDEDV